MIRIVLEVDAPPGCVIGVKESVSMAAEPYGSIRVVSVEETLLEQIKIQG